MEHKFIEGQEEEEKEEEEEIISRLVHT